MKITELIKRLEAIQEKHGDLDLYIEDDARIFEYNSEFRPRACKMYTQKWENAEYMRENLSDGDLEYEDEDLHDVDLNKPIFKAVLL